MITHEQYLEAQKIVDAYNSQLKQSDVSGCYSDETRHLAYRWFDEISEDELHRCMEKYSKISLVEKDIIEMYVGEHNNR